MQEADSSAPLPEDYHINHNIWPIATATAVRHPVPQLRSTHNSTSSQFNDFRTALRPQDSYRLVILYVRICAGSAQGWNIRRRMTWRLSRKLQKITNQHCRVL
ncbi:hypothetical protein E4U15_004456 [Claviceps sp. LM218 group G6]|nr:hypothetical protein E4U15_004456 [Claviceps sp. LM218 group G6]